ncbi:unnamed protein product [Rotaria socialis]|uniref:Uncharacterized protein n=1 Tax=Rotaria socialis TaxID=392032 RepID=A0A818NM47_9BILA|nr:unnamed protein product [Rotaria socialis]CAF4556337.1 unnamed protein product [Rotaria socialis]
MDKWIADNIDQEIEDGRAIRNNYNQSRRLSRMQTFNMNKHVASSREDHLSFEDPMNNSPDESDSDSGDDDDDDGKIN